MIFIKLIIDAICAALNLIGGYSWHNARRYIMPVVIAGALSWFTGVWWLGLTVLPTMGLLSIGYGENSLFGKIFGVAWARFVWMLLCCVGFSLGALLTGHLVLFFFVSYILGAGIIGITLRNLNEIVGDIIFGAWFGSIVYLVR